jgi:hypothetical protein
MGKKFIVEEVDSNSSMGCLSIIGLLTVIFFLGTCLVAVSK